MTCNTNQLLSDGRCFSCLTPGQLELVRMQLLCEIVNVASGGCIPPSQPTAVSFVGGVEEFGVTWAAVSDPNLDFLVEWGPVAGPPFAFSQSVAANLRFLSNVPVAAGNFFGRVTARNTVSCVTVGTPDNDPFTATEPFSPDDIGGLMFWLDAADSGTLVLSGSDVTSWTDKVQSIVMTNGGVAASPTFDPIDAFGHPVVDFASGIGQGLVSGPGDNINAPPPYTVFFAGRMNAPGAAFQSSLAMFNHDSTVLIHLLYMGASSARNVTEFDNGPAANTRTDDNVYADNTPVVISCVAPNASVQSFWIDGVAVGLQMSSTPTEGWTTTDPQVVVGIEAGDGTGSNFFDGGMYEILIYNSELNTTDRQLVETYLIAKWT